LQPNKPNIHRKFILIKKPKQKKITKKTKTKNLTYFVKAIMIDERRFFRTNLVLMQRRKENGAGTALKKLMK
jgi:thymidine kinase